MKAVLKIPYFPRALSWSLLGILGPTSIYLLFFDGNVWMGLFLCALIITSYFNYYLTVMDKERKPVQDDFFFWGFRASSQSHSFCEFTHMSLEKERKTCNAKQRSRDRLADFYEYVAYLHDDKNAKLELVRKSDWRVFKKIVEKLAANLALDVRRTEF
jgi:hypothetical protein